MGKPRTYTDEDIITAVANSFSIRQVLKKLNLAQAGGSYNSINKIILKLKLDTSHFTGQLWNKGKILSPKRDIQTYLSNEYPMSSHKLRLRLIKEGLFEAKCYSCQSVSWLDKPIALELEHINGDHSDNTLSNLTLLCPNCHAQTKTYRGKNKKLT
jgi:hypothetical protein